MPKTKKIKEIEENSISDAEIRYYLPSANILTYPELSIIEDIEQLLPRNDSYFILLYLDTENSGHWVSLKRFNNNIDYFCSYGTFPDDQIRKWYGAKLAKQLGQNKLYLSNLLNKTKLNVNYNDVDYQNKNIDIVTCGRWCIDFIKSGKNLKQYYKMMQKLRKQTGKTYDELISDRISIILD
jgi:hypothetical protein